MKTLISQTLWQFKILHKNNLILISVLVTAVYALIFYFLKDLPNMEKVLTLLVYNDPAIIGLFFIGLAVIIEKNQAVLSALFVTPMNLHVYLLSRLLSLSIIGWACGLGMGVSLLGLEFNWLHYSFGVFGTTVLFSLVGIFVVSYTSEFLLFMLKSIPLLILFSLPLFNYFNLTEAGAFYFTPMQGGLNLIANSFAEQPSSNEIIYGYAATIVWIPILYFLVYRTFKNRMIKAM